MFLDIGWSEMLVVAVVLIVVVGPKDLPGMLRTFGRVMSQMRSMASDFRKQVDDALKESEFDDVRKSVDDMRSLDPRRQLRDAMKPMHDIGNDIRSSVRSATEMPADRQAPKAVPPQAVPPQAEPPLKTGAVSNGSVGGAARAEAPADAVPEPDSNGRDGGLRASETAERRS